MKIGYDVSQTAENKSGTGFFADQMVRKIAKIDSENEYILFPWFYGYTPLHPEVATKIEKSNFSTMICRDIEEKNPDLDVIHSNNFKFPSHDRAKKIVTIYDVGFLDYPEYTTEANRLACFEGTLNSMIFADKIITISEYSKERLLHYFPIVDESKISVIYLGNRETLLQEPNAPDFLNRLGIQEDKFFLSVGTIEPRKNYHTLLKAYKIYKERNSDYLKLCIAGGYGWLEEQFNDEIAELGLQDDVIVTGYVSDNELANLYRYCFAFVYPTWYEGFGLPPLEAMSFAKPVIVSKVASLPEVVGNAGILIDPADDGQIADAMELLLQDSTSYKDRAALGLIQAKQFSWEKAAAELLEIYRSMA